MQKLILFIFLLSSSFTLHSQIGGRYVFEFLGNPQSSRLTALGGSLIAVQDDDVNLGMANPALLNDTMHNQVSVSHNFSFAGVSNGHISYARKMDKLGGINTHLGVSYVNFGEFVASDEIGNDLGTFSGGETAVVVGASRQMNERITLGANLKGIFGSLEAYSSVAIGADLGLFYAKPGSNFGAALVVKNIGSQLTAYGNERGILPLDMQLGISRKLNHLPLRFSIVVHQLQRWGIRYDDPDRQSSDTFLDENVTEPSSLSRGVDNLFRHFIFNGEFLLGKKQGLKIRLGYNHLRRAELSLANFRSLAGFSGGVGIKIKGFILDYGIGHFHQVGATNHITIRTNFRRFFRKF